MEMDLDQPEKPFIPLNQQIEKLKARGLIISLPKEAENQLLRTSYYDLINGYKNMFLMEKSSTGKDDRFIEGTRFEDIQELYYVDRKIRHITLEVLLDVECVFYSCLSYCISEAYGEKHTSYLKKENYRLGRKQRFNNRYERDNLLRRIEKKIESPEEQPLLYYKERYNNIPPWILVKDLSFGELLMLYKLSSESIKSKLIERITGDEPTQENKEFFLKSMEIFNRFRNLSAHGGRIYNYKTNIELPYSKTLFDKLSLVKADHNMGRGRNDFTAFIIALMFFFQTDPKGMLEFIINLNFTLERYQTMRPIEYIGVLNELGIPSNYNLMLLKGIGIS